MDPNNSNQKIIEGPANQAIQDMPAIHHLGNPVFTSTFTSINYDDPIQKQQGEWYQKQSNILYKTSSGNIGKYPLKASDMPVVHYSKDQSFSEAAIKTGRSRDNGFNTHLDKSRTLDITAYSTRYVKMLG